MLQDPEFVMPELVTSSAPQANAEAEATSLAPVAATSKPDLKHPHNQRAGSVLAGVVIGVAATSFFNQSIPDESEEETRQETALFNGTGDVEATQIGTPAGTKIVDVRTNLTQDSITVELRTSPISPSANYRLTASQPLPELVSENQATFNTLGAHNVNVQPGEFGEATITLDLSDSHPNLPYQVSLGQFNSSGVLEELDSAKILLAEMCEPPLHESTQNVYCWNSQ